MTDLLFVGLAVLVVVAGIAVRRGEKGRRELSDAEIRQIESLGRIDAEDVDPLDVDEIRAEEDEFWDQSWDEPEDWRG